MWACLVLSSLAAAAAAADTCTSPLPAASAPTPPPLALMLNASLSCSVGTVTSAVDSLSLKLQSTAPATAFVDVRSTIYDRPASRLQPGKKVRTGLVTSTAGWNRNSLNDTLAAIDALATAGPLDLLTLEEEHNCNKGFTKAACCGADNCALTGPFLTALKATAKRHSLWIVVPMRTLDLAGDMHNAAVVVNRQGELVRSAMGQLAYQKT